MSKADKMFEELGYKKIIDDDNEIAFERRKQQKYFLGIKLIEFLKNIKTIEVNYSELENRDVGMETIECTSSISIQELQAINEKVKELGWVGE